MANCCRIWTRSDCSFCIWGTCLTHCSTRRPHLKKDVRSLCMTVSETRLLSLCSLIGVTCARRRLMWSSTSLSTSPHTPPQTSPAPCAIRSSPASPVSNLTSCCTRRRRWAAAWMIKHFLCVCIKKTLFFPVLCGPFFTLLQPLQNLICAECGDEFVLQSQLSLHLEEHRKELSGIKVYTCKTCDKEFKTSAHLKEHTKTHVKMRSGWDSDITLLHFTESDRKLHESNSY